MEKTIPEIKTQEKPEIIQMVDAFKKKIRIQEEEMSFEEKSALDRKERKRQKKERKEMTKNKEGIASINQEVGTIMETLQEVLTDPTLSKEDRQFELQSTLAGLAMLNQEYPDMLSESFSQELGILKREIDEHVGGLKIKQEMSQEELKEKLGEMIDKEKLEKLLTEGINREELAEMLLKENQKKCEQEIQKWIKEGSGLSGQGGFFGKLINKINNFEFAKKHPIAAKALVGVATASVVLFIVGALDSHAAPGGESGEGGGEGGGEGEWDMDKALDNFSNEGIDASDGYNSDEINILLETAADANNPKTDDAQRILGELREDANIKQQIDSVKYFNEIEDRIGIDSHENGVSKEELIKIVKTSMGDSDAATEANKLLYNDLMQSRGIIGDGDIAEAREGAKAEIKTEFENEHNLLKETGADVEIDDYGNAGITYEVGEGEEKDFDAFDKVSRRLILDKAQIDNELTAEKAAEIENGVRNCTGNELLS